MAYQDFINDYKKEIVENSLLFYGAEDYLMDWAVNQIVDKYIDETARNVDYQILDGETSAVDIMSAAGSYSMFSEKRVIVVKNYLPLYRKSADVDSDALIEYCIKNNDSSILIFMLESKFESDITSFGKKLMKAVSTYEFAKLDKANLKGFINKRIHEAGKLLGHREMDYLIDVSGYYNKGSNYSLTELDRDLNAICNAAESDQIENDLIENLLVGEQDKYVFNLVDYLMSGNKAKAMQLAETIISEDDGSMSVLALLNKQFEIMYDALELSEKGMTIPEMAKLTGVNEFRFKKAYQSARNFSIQKLKDILVKIYNIDRDIKTGAIDKDTAFELLIISI